MGNIISAVLMYALEAAWLLQRLIDQDYRQNHGSRLKPLREQKYETPMDIFLPQSSSTPILAKSPHRCSKPVKTKTHNSSEQRRHRKRCDSFRSHQGEQERKRSLVEREIACEAPADPLRTTAEYVNSVRHSLGLRRAFSDINLSCCGTEHRTYCDDNHNEVPDDFISSTDQAILRLVLSRGCMSDRRHDRQVYSVL